MTRSSAARPRPAAQILAERTALVGEMARLNAEQLRCSQRAGGLEIELLARRREIKATGGSEEAGRSLEAAQELEAGNDAERARREALARQLEALDRELAGT